MILRGMPSPYFPFKKDLMRRVLDFAAASEAQGLVAEFGRRFRDATTSVNSTKPGSVSRLQIFMKAVADPPPIDEEAMAGAHNFVMSLCEGQPRSVRALNVVAFRENKLDSGGGIGWRDASNDPSPDGL